MRAQLVFWMLAAIDGHAKNFSIRHLPGGAFELAPLYDILSAYPVLGHGRGRLAAQKIKMAMAVHGKNRHYHWKEIRARHWMETAKRCGFGDMRQAMEETVERTAEAVAGAAKLLPKHFPESIAEPIFKGVAGRARQLAEELAKRAPG
jgi:serine/threonine-protein kinase HipA